MCKNVGRLEDVIGLQNDLNNLYKWSIDWQMQFNVDKFSVIHIGNKNLNNTYKLGNSNLRSSDKERDLGVIVDSGLKFADQCNKVVKEAYSTLGLIKRTIKFKSKNNILRLYIKL